MTKPLEQQKKEEEGEIWRMEKILLINENTVWGSAGFSPNPCRLPRILYLGKGKKKRPPAEELSKTQEKRLVKKFLPVCGTVRLSGDWAISFNRG